MLQLPSRLSLRSPPTAELRVFIDETKNHGFCYLICGPSNFIDLPQILNVVVDQRNCVGIADLNVHKKSPFAWRGYIALDVMRYNEEYCLNNSYSATSLSVLLATCFWRRSTIFSPIGLDGESDPDELFRQRKSWSLLQMLIWTKKSASRPRTFPLTERSSVHLPAKNPLEFS